MSTRTYSAMISTRNRVRHALGGVALLGLCACAPGPGEGPEQAAADPPPGPTTAAAVPVQPPTPVDTPPPTPDDLRNRYYDREMDRLTAAGDSVLQADVTLPTRLALLDGWGTAYLLGGVPAAAGDTAGDAAPLAVELVAGGRCAGQRLLLHPMAGATDRQGMPPVLTVEGYAPPDQRALAVPAGACPAVIGTPVASSRDSLRALVGTAVAEAVVPFLERERGTPLETRLVRGSAWTFPDQPIQAWVTVALKPVGDQWEDQVALVGLRRAAGGWDVVYRSDAPMADPAVDARWTPEPLAALDLDGDGRPEVVGEGSYPSMGEGGFHALIIYGPGPDGTYTLRKAIPVRRIVH